MSRTAPVTTGGQSDFFAPHDLPAEGQPEIPDGFKKAIGVVQVAMGRLGFLHRKLYNVMIANAYEGLGEGKTQFSIPASMMAELAGFDSNNYQVLYDHCRALMQTEVLTLNFDNRQRGGGGKRPRRGGTTLIADFDVIEGGTIHYSFSSKMAGLLHEPDQYIWMALSIQNRFSSKYELGLFENCIRYVGIGTTGFKDVAEWRAVLGAEDPTYDQFKELNKKVLKPAAAGVNGKSGILVVPEFERRNRRVARIRFSVRENPQLSLLDHKAHSRIRNCATYKAARALGLEDVVAIHFIETKGETYVRDALKYVRHRNPKNPGGYLAHALRSGYAEPTPEQREGAEAATARQNAIQSRQEAVQRAQAAQEALEARFAQHRAARTQTLLAALSAAERADVVDAMSADIAIPAVAREWQAMARDPARLPEARGGTRKIMGERLARAVLERWGRAEDLDIEAFRAAGGAAGL